MIPASLDLAALLPPGFHFLRPDWLWAIVPALALAALAFRRFGAGSNPWRHLVDAHLLRYLSVQETARARRWPVLALLLGWVLAAFAMAGPAWQKLPTPALDRLDPTVIVLSLAQSMNATDQSPSRLGAARHKVDDILARMRGGQVGLVIYADAPFVAAPLTEDGRIIAQMLPELSTELMPVLADRADLALDRATALLRDAGAPAGRIVLITDGAGDDPAATLAAAKAAAQAGYRVNVIGVGTQAGSPLLAFDGGVLRARDGTVVTTRMDEARLREIAAAGRGSFSAMTVGDGDLDTVLAKTSGSAAPLDTVLQDSGLSADQWLDMGPWLLLGVLALAPLAFRRGWIAVLLVAALGGALAPRDAQAQGAISQGAPPQSLDLRGLDGQSTQGQGTQGQGTQGQGTQGQGTQNLGAQGSASAGADAGGSRGWDGLWRTPDQQGADAFGRADYGTAARSFENPQWQASALYKAGSYDEAAAAYAKVPDGDYNRGNALARAGKLEEAIKAYDAALAAHPGQDDPIRADALFNRELVQKVLDQRKKDQQKKDQDKKDQDKKDQQKQDPKSGTDQKPKDEPGKDEKKDKPQKPDDKKPDQPPPTPDPKGTPQKPEPQKPEPPKAPPKPEPQKPEPPKPNPQDQKPSDQKPPEQKPPEKPPEQKPPEPPPPEPPPQPPQPGAPKPLTEEDQNRAQTLRLVPDDPTGLLRARIRSHYGGAGVVDPSQN